MEDAKAFKERNLATAQKYCPLPPSPLLSSLTVCCVFVLRTMESLQMEKTKREKELNQIRQSEPKLIREIAGLKESMMRMNEEMKVH
jgi:hypothetical protein